jgi:hypothetical protein
MSIADTVRLLDFERRLTALEALLGVEAAGGTTDGPEDGAQPPAIDAQLARVVAVLADGASIRDTAKRLSIHRSSVARLRQRAIEAGLLVSARDAGRDGSADQSTIG